MNRAKRREAERVTSSLRLRGEISRLERRVQRLERTLDAMLGTTDETFVDMRTPRKNLALVPEAPADDFATAWHDSDAAASRVDDFFGREPDEMRARRWLLASK